MKKKVLMIVCAVIILAIAAVLIIGLPGAETAEGSKSVTIEVVDADGKTTVYEVKTDAEYLQGAMDDAKGLKYEGEEGPYGLQILTVNGLRAVYEKDNAYWGFFVNGEYCNYGISEQPIADGDVFRIEYTPA